MPGKYLEFVKSGRYAVPIEMFFLPTSYTDEITGKESVTSKWVERKHWKEIKGLLKPAVDSCTNSNADGFSSSPHISQGQEVTLGYVLCVDSTKEKSPFHAVLESKKNCWTDDEDDFDELDELCAGLRDHGGGTHRTHVPTKIYVKACVIKRTSSALSDSKKLKKELGFKGEDLRSYFQNTSPSGTSAGLASSLHDKDWKESRNKRFGFGTLSGADTDKIRPFMPSLPRRLTMERPPGAVCSRNGGTYYEEQDDDEDSDDGYKEVDLNNEEDSGGSDDDNFSLPDIDAPQLDIQMKQLRKDMLKEEKQKLAAQKTHRHEKRKNRLSKLGVESGERKKSIRLMNPMNGNFVQKIGVSSSLPTSPVKNSTIIADPISKKSKKRVATKALISDNTVTSPKKSKTTFKLVVQERENNVVSMSSAKLRDQPHPSFDDSINTTITVPAKKDTSTKKVSKRKRKHDRNGSSGEIVYSNNFLEGSTSPIKSKDHVLTKQRISKRHKKETATIGPGDNRLNDETPIEDIQNEVTKTKKKKKKQIEFKSSELQSHLDKKNEKGTKKPQEFSRLEPREIELLQLEIDPDMPVLSPAVNSDEVELPQDQIDDTPPTITTMMEPVKKKKSKYIFSKKKKLKDQDNKSTSTQTQEDSQEFQNATPETNRGQKEGGNIDDSNSHIFVSVDVNAEGETRQKLSDFLEDDANIDGREFNIQSHRSHPIQDHQFLQPPAIMPPPSRPAPRTPKKGDHRKQLFRSGGGLSVYPFGSKTSADPARLSTIQIMYHPNLLRAGVGLLNNLTSKKMTAEEVGNRLGFSDISETKARARKKRELSPDITAFPHPPKSNGKNQHNKSRERKNDFGTNFKKVTTVQKRYETLGRLSEEEFSDTDNQEQGETLIRELLDRVHTSTSDNLPAYEPEGDEFDLSQRSMCYLNMIPGYSQKSRSFKIHCKNVTNLTFDKLVEHYIGIRPILRQIFEGEVPNDRSKLYLQSAPGKRVLQDMSVSIPFDHDQTSSIITLLLEYFIPDIEQRPKWSDYVNYVLLPEALILIYSRVNEITYEIAEKEMRFQGCYDDVSL